MKITTELYETSQHHVPASGQQIIGHHSEEYIVVYQAYKPSIAATSVQKQQLSGSDFSYNRMSWIKPNFLWMMFRCGWAEKENQERVLALWVPKKAMISILEQAVMSSFKSEYHNDQAAWQKDLQTKEVRLQWDPDHDPYGNKITRRAIQLGLKGDILASFGREMITGIEDITDFVRQQKKLVNLKKMEALEIPRERVWPLHHPALEKQVGITL